MRNNNLLFENFFFDLAVVFFISLLLNFILIKISPKLKLMDIPNRRSLKSKAIPRSGGIAIFISTIIGVILFDYRIDKAVILGFILIFLLGLYDDFKTIRARTKLLFLIPIVTILFFCGIKINNLGIFLGHTIILTGVSAYLFFLFSAVGFINAMNLIDGLDGLATIISIIIFGAFSYIGFMYHDTFLFFTPLIMITSLFGFLIFNFNPAKIFMGDSGSLTLGYSVVIFSIYSFDKGYLTPISILLIASIPILDTMIILLKRTLSGKNPFKADNNHIHHIILRQQRRNVKKTALLIGGMQFLFTYIGLGFKARDDFIILIAYILLFIIFYNFLNVNRSY